MGLATSYLSNKLFDELLEIVKSFESEGRLAALEYKVLSTQGVCCLQHTHRYENGWYEEEMEIYFEDGACILVSFAKDVYDLELLPSGPYSVDQAIHETVKL